MSHADRPRRRSHPRTEPLERRALLDALPQGPELHVNTHTTSNQFNSAVAMDNAGNFVVVWQSAGQDGNSDGIYAQRFSALGAPLGEEFLANETTTGSQQTPTVAMDDDGDFVVAWNSIGQGGVNGEVWARRFTSAGVPVDHEFHVNTVTEGGQNNPQAAMDGAGNFVVAWFSLGDAYDIYARRYNASGVALAEPFLVSAEFTGNQINPAVAMDTDGDFVVTWQSSIGDGSSSGVYARRFDQTGAGAPQFLVNQTTTNAQRLPAVAMDTVGNFVVAWESNLQDGSFYGIYARRFAAAGTPLAGEFRVNSTTTDQQRVPAVAMDSGGDFTVAWASRLQDGSLYGIYAQAYSAAGAATGTEFKVNTYTTGTQFNPSLAFDADGDFVVTWQSDGQEGVGGGFGVYMQRYGTDVSSPAVISSDFVWQNAPQRIEYVFNQTVTVEPADLLIENLTTMTTIPTANIAVTTGPNQATVTFPGYAPIGALPDGRYRVTLLAGAVSPTLPANDVDEFFFLMGDANHDAFVNLADFNLLAANFGQTGRNFGQGNFNYDAGGLVNLQDFNLLASRFGMTVAPASTAAAAEDDVTNRNDRDDDRMIGVVD